MTEPTNKLPIIWTLPRRDGGRAFEHLRRPDRHGSIHYGADGSGPVLASLVYYESPTFRTRVWADQPFEDYLEAKIWVEQELNQQHPRVAPFDIRTLEELGTERVIGYFCKGHVDRAQFLTEVREHWEPERAIWGDVQHVLWRAVASNSPRRWCYVPAEKRGRGVFTATVVYVK